MSVILNTCETLNRAEPPHRTGIVGAHIAEDFVARQACRNERCVASSQVTIVWRLVFSLDCRHWGCDSDFSNDTVHVGVAGPPGEAD